MATARRNWSNRPKEQTQRPTQKKPLYFYSASPLCWVDNKSLRAFITAARRPTSSCVLIAAQLVEPAVRTNPARPTKKKAPP